jgi:hypothetical protein
MTRKLPWGTGYFAELGERIDARWRSHDYADRALPPIAEEELRRRPPHEHVSPWDLAQLGRSDEPYTDYEIALDAAQQIFDAALAAGTDAVVFFH